MSKLLVLCLLFSWLALPHQDRREMYAVDLSHADASEAAAIRSPPGVAVIADLGDIVVLETSGSIETDLPVERLQVPTSNHALYIAQRLHRNEITGDTRQLAATAGYSLIATTPKSLAEIVSDPHVRVFPLERGRVYATAGASAQLSKTSEQQAAADAIDADRWLATLADLVAFRTRFTGTQGALDARDYLAGELSSIGLQVETQLFKVGASDAWNVIGEIRGTTRPDDIYIVCGHYDSISERATELAPGAEDNGSGAAGVVEIARVIAAQAPAATVRFVLFSGEEQGLFGSTAYVNRLLQRQEDDSVRAVINMDMISFSRDEDLDVLLEAGSNGAALVNTMAASANAVTNLRVVTSFNPFGSDHVPFIRNGIPAVLAIENDWDQYPGYHRTTDTLDNVNREMGSQVLRMNAAAMALLAGTGGDSTVITSVKFAVKSAGPRLVVDGRFAWNTSRIEVDGVPLAQTIFRKKFRDGSVTTRLQGADPALTTKVPVGVQVRVRVVDTATGASTAEFPFTR